MKARTGFLLAAIVGLALLLAIPAVLFVSGANKASSQFTPLPTGPINAEITAIRDGFVNLYALQKDGNYLVIDAGNHEKNVAAELARTGIDLAKVTTVLLTHTDYDHVAAISLFQNATVYISEQEENMLNGKTHRFFIFNNSLKVPHQWLEDGETVTIGGWQIQTIVIPGHTVGSACYIIDGKYLFTGDSTSIKNGEIGPGIDFFNMNTAELSVSLRKLTGLANVELLLSAHFRTTGGITWQK